MAQAGGLAGRWRRPQWQEILAHGFKTYGIGPVVGERTAGAVVAGRALLLSDWSFLYLAVFDVLVDGERLEGRGVEPDVVVERPIPYAAGADPQLERALEVAAGEVAAGKVAAGLTNPESGA